MYAMLTTAHSDGRASNSRTSVPRQLCLEVWDFPGLPVSMPIHRFARILCTGWAKQWRNEGFQRPGARFHACAPLQLPIGSKLTTGGEAEMKNLSNDVHVSVCISRTPQSHVNRPSRCCFHFLFCAPKFGAPNPILRPPF